MVFHHCIKCNEFELIPIAEVCPTFQKYECPECETTQWIYHSRLNPQTYPEDIVEVNEETHSVKLKGDITKVLGE